MELFFREATEADLPGIVSLMIDDDLAGDRDDDAPESLPVYRQALAEIRAQPGNRVLVAEIEIDGGRRIVACTQFAVLAGLSRRGMRRAQLEHVRVSRELRGTGVGSRFMEHVIDLARSEGCGMVQLTADVSRVDAHRFYEALGFEASHKGLKLRF